ncbi:hypothetical protein PF005_g30238 [Phytophthora fragariae]|uniref:RxLR effector protein n=1 Tax=Phytophthora fragariae TaxID=53985 RepID=A0A6A3DCU8_9STRA|nr:hypothetical protein PF003_g21858 [Phytophthora fragariae]KAE8919219.1 hypothetical protein PF009_g30470 [Phytophthora fragariae]KAE8962775.1 hypothetical protein PF011_g29256 [Phytophthora fragariae]KAE9061440.1 hypothetical protein PF010_g29817 [Phytophthora fragariae]KAE9062594.1 hypothetical protein PF007_g29853 [Phytophthora fragariae]
MRFTYFLLIATATLLSSCNASAAVSGDTQAKLSTMTSTDAAVPARAVDASNIKRILRTYHDDDEDEEDEEERVNPDKLNAEALAIWTAKWAAKADDWFNRGHTPVSIHDKLSGLNDVMNRKNGRKYYLFMKKWNSEHGRRD